VYGVTMTMKPNEIAAIVLDVDPLKTRSCSTIWKRKLAGMKKMCFTNDQLCVPFEVEMWEVDENFQSFKAVMISLMVVGSQSISVKLLPIHADCGECATTIFVFVTSEVDRIIAVVAEKPQIQVSRSTNF
jgi:hypothetical protein